jgi:hypothetical protein
LRKQRPPSVHDKASRPKQPGELQPNRQTDFKSTPSKIARNLLANNQDFFDPSRLTGQQWPESGAEVDELPKD